jgi:hypothetical protein
LLKRIDGTPDAAKVARPVWGGGKDGDNVKVLPITISRTPVLHGVNRVHLLRGAGRRKELYHVSRHDKRKRRPRGRRGL